MKSRRAVEAKRKEQQEQTTAHEQGKKVSFFTNKEKEAHEAAGMAGEFHGKQEWSARSARGRVDENRRKGARIMKMSGFQSVPNMESGSSYLRTTYPRDQVEKIVMDGLEERQTGRAK